MPRIVFIVLEGGALPLLLQNPTMVAQATVNINVEITLTNSPTVSADNDVRCAIASCALDVILCADGCWSK